MKWVLKLKKSQIITIFLVNLELYIRDNYNISSDSELSVDFEYIIYTVVPSLYQKSLFYCNCAPWRHILQVRSPPAYQCIYYANEGEYNWVTCRSCPLLYNIHCMAPQSKSSFLDQNLSKSFKEAQRRPAVLISINSDNAEVSINSNIKKQ